MEATKIGMPLEEFIRLYDAEGAFELINGERTPLLPQVAGHGEVVQTFWFSLDRYAMSRRLGDTCMRTPFVEIDSQDYVLASRTPDIMFYQTNRIQHYKAAMPDWRLKPYILVPDLVVEVVSPNDDLRELDEKVDLYLADGVRVVWVVDPQPGKVSVYIPIPEKPHTKQQTTLSNDAILTGGEIIPGFEMRVAALFE